MIKQLRANGAFAECKDQLIEIIKPAGGEWGIVIDALDGEDSIHLNPEDPFRAASVIKIPIMMAAFSRSQGRQNPPGRYHNPEKPRQSRRLRGLKGTPFRT